MNIKMIAAVSRNGIIGDADKNTIPWQGKYPEDFKFFRKMTTGDTVIFGRKTFESIGKPLPKRTNVVITRQEKIEGVSCYQSLKHFIDRQSVVLEDVITTKWICGGAGLYHEGMNYASEIYLTMIPEDINGSNLVHFPWINPLQFRIDAQFNIEESELVVIKYVRT